jgi:hypothetical protein
MLRERKAFLVWLTTMALVVVISSTVSKCHHATRLAPLAAGGGPAPHLSAPTEVSPWRLAP